MVNRLEDWSAGQDRALTAMGYNLCQLRLQRAMEGKAPGEARGLLTDCFLDGGGVASLTGGLVRHPAGGLYLSVTKSAPHGETRCSLPPPARGAGQGSGSS